MLYATILTLSIFLPAPSVEERVDAYLNHRFEQTAEKTAALVKEFEKEGVSIEAVEKAIASGPQKLATPDHPKGEIVANVPMQCDHVDYKTSYYLYVPKSLPEGKPTGLIVVGHGGNGAMSQSYANRTAAAYIADWPGQAERLGYIAVAPLTERGWGWIGDSIVFSAISQLSRQYRIDPNRIYITGHSMGGHLTWRSAFGYPGAWAAVSPMSGGYDFVAQGLMPLLFNVPGYATHGATEPFEIADFNRKMKAWLDKRNYDWVIDERPGGHEVFKDRLPIIGDFFAKRRRNIYPKSVFAQHRGLYALDRAEPKRDGWSQGHTWTKGRPIDRTTFFWIRLNPEPEKDQSEDFREAFAEIKSSSEITITAKNVKEITLFLHPKMVTFGKPLTITVNGKATKHTPKPTMGVLLEEARRFDDRGRLFWDEVKIPVEGDREVPVPSGRGA